MFNKSVALVKFALAVNSDTSTSELMNVQTWAEENNIKLNCSKSVIFQ